ncbi:LamG-like jellyroll fold domain-containing protein [Ferruginibacter sp. SUN106]|uniref:LamG-like jellyroll fold domain-containing protein n=1 Tax=Ferruginibacter sp. SUN106 TaxID=2978348 RepID=UPI003D3619E9
MKQKSTSLLANLKIILTIALFFSLSSKTNAQGNALNFDGINDHVIIGPSAGLYAAGGAYTKEAWILKGNWFTAENIVSSKDPFFIEYDQHVNASNDYIIPNQEHYDVINPEKLENNHWVHMAVTFDGVSTMKMYHNGVLVDVNTAAPYTSASGQNYIGCFFDTDAGHVDYFFTGAMDEIRIYNIALTQAQIQADMVSPTPAVPASLLAHYNFNNGVAEGNNTGLNTLTDMSGNGNNGAMVNFANTGATSNWVGSYAMIVPVGNAATTVLTNSFQANWSNPVFGSGFVDQFRMEVSDVSDFSSLIAAPFYIPFGTNSFTVSGLLPNHTYYYKVSADKAGFSNQGAFSNVITVTTLAVLPVNLLSFNVSKANGSNQLLWSTATEVNSKYFELLRSEDGRTFTTIAKVNSNGNSSSVKNYQYADVLPATLAPIYYYRLKMVDINGSYIYSDIVLIKNTKAGTITIYPNPAQEKVIVNITDKNLLRTTASLSDISGKLLQTVNITQTATSINISSYEKGVYVLRLANGESIKFVKE